MNQSNKLHILMIPSWYPSEMDPNGVPFTRAQAQALVRAGHKVTVVFTQAYSLKTVVKQKRLMWGVKRKTVEGVEEIHSYVPKTHLKRIDERTRLVQGKRILKRWISRENTPHIIHVHTYLAGDLALWYSRQYNIPIITTEHYTGFARGIVKKWEMKRAKRLYRHSCENLAVSQSFADILYKETGVPFRQLPNMVNTDRFNIARENSSSEAYTFLFVGLLHEKKNPVMLLQAFHRAYAQNNSLRLIIVGEGEQESLLKSYVKSNNLDEAVDFRGFVQNEAIPIIMNQADAFILPSRFETFGIVCIEAMACGLPVIATRSGGPESFIKEFENGLIIDQDEQQLYEAIQSVYQNQWHPRNIREYVVENFSENAVIGKLEEIYRDMIEKPSILQATRDFSLSGGICKVARQMAVQLTKREYKITTYTAEEKLDENLTEWGKVIKLELPSWINKLPPYLKNYFSTVLFTREVNSIYKYKNKDPHSITISHRDSFGADIAIGHSCHSEAVEVKKRGKNPFWRLNPVHRFYLKQEKAICRPPYPHLAAISKSIAEEYEKYYGIPSDKTSSIPNGVDTLKFAPDEDQINRTSILDELSLSSDAFLLLFVGNEFRRKGLEYVIESLEVLDDAEIHLLVLGGANPDPYKARIKGREIEKQVHFLGRRDDAERFFSGSDLFVIPADYEPFGLVGIEAMSSGIPVLASPLGGFLDYLEEGNNGFFIKRKDTDIAEKISLIKKDKSLYEKLAHGARKTAEDYSWDIIGEKYSRLIDKVAEEKAST